MTHLHVCFMYLYFIVQMVIYVRIKALPRPPSLPDIDNCTPLGGICINGSSMCEGFIDTWRLCRNGQICCKPSPSTLYPEPPYPASETCGVVTRVPKRGNLRIFGGSDSEEGEWPWMVRLSDTNGHFCGGTLITNRWVLTAAHCLESKKLHEVNLTLGEHHTAFSTGREVTAHIDTWIMHPDYIPNTRGFHHDIALIRLKQESDISGHYVRTACLPLANIGYNAVPECNISGWGYTAGTRQYM